MKNPRRTKAQIAAGFEYPEPDRKWCSLGGHWADLELFARSTRHRRQAWCRACRSRYMREHRAIRNETERYRSDEAYAKKVRARSAFRMAVKRGNIERQPCSQCGAPNAQGHHDDYDRPLDVRWLCAGCHALEHTGPRGRYSVRTGPQGTRWCSRHDSDTGAWVPEDQFSGAQRYCKTCRAAYMREWRRRPERRPEGQL